MCVMEHVADRQAGTGWPEHCSGSVTALGNEEALPLMTGLLSKSRQRKRNWISKSPKETNLTNTAKAAEAMILLLHEWRCWY